MSKVTIVLHERPNQVTISFKGVAKSFGQVLNAFLAFPGLIADAALKAAPSTEGELDCVLVPRGRVRRSHRAAILPQLGDGHPKLSEQALIMHRLHLSVHAR